MLSVGRLIDGKYEILKPLGEGGFGQVWLTKQSALDRLVAVKILSDTTFDEETTARFEREAKLLSKMSHPNIALFLGYGIWEGRRYTVLEYVEGETLFARLNKGKLSLEKTLAIGKHTAVAAVNTWFSYFQTCDLLNDRESASDAVLKAVHYAKIANPKSWNMTRHVTTCTAVNKFTVYKKSDEAVPILQQELPDIEKLPHDANTPGVAFYYRLMGCIYAAQDNKVEALRWLEKGLKTAIERQDAGLELR